MLYRSKSCLLRSDTVYQGKRTFTGPPWKRATLLETLPLKRCVLDQQKSATSDTDQPFDDWIQTSLRHGTSFARITIGICIREGSRAAEDSCKGQRLCRSGQLFEHVLPLYLHFASYTSLCRSWPEAASEASFEWIRLSI